MGCLRKTRWHHKTEVDTRITAEKDMLAITREILIQNLLRIGGLIDHYQRRDPNFASQVIDWLVEAEKALLQLRHPLASFLAAERGRILAANDGYIEASSTGEIVKKRKAIPVVAALVLSRVQEVLRTAIDDIDKKFDGWREKMAQFLAVATATKPIPLPPTEPRQTWLMNVWLGLSIPGETQGMYGYLNAAMRPSDRLYLLEEVVANFLNGK